jgi:hypothetical protein
VQQLTLSAEAWEASNADARAAAEDVLDSLCGCKHLNAFNADIERLYAILWAAYAWQDYQLPLWFLRLMALVLELGMLVQHGFVLPVLLVVLAERVCGTAIWVTAWLRAAFVACADGSSPVASSCVMHCMAGALRVLGTNIYGFIFYMLTPAACAKDGRKDAVRVLLQHAGLPTCLASPDMPWSTV